MPELPDVEGFKRVLAKNALRKTIDRIVVSDARKDWRGAFPSTLRAAAEGGSFFARLKAGGPLTAAA